MALLPTFTYALMIQCPLQSSFSAVIQPKYEKKFYLFQRFSTLIDVNFNLFFGCPHNFGSSSSSSFTAEGRRPRNNTSVLQLFLSLAVVVHSARVLPAQSFISPPRLLLSFLPHPDDLQTRRAIFTVHMLVILHLRVCAIRDVRMKWQ